jgi:hypothetical protein
MKDIGSPAELISLKLLPFAGNKDTTEGDTTFHLD